MVEPFHNEWERLSGLGMLLIQRGLTYIPEPESVYDMKANWR